MYDFILVCRCNNSSAGVVRPTSCFMRYIYYLDMSLLLCVLTFYCTQYLKKNMSLMCDCHVFINKRILTYFWGQCNANATVDNASRGESRCATPLVNPLISTGNYSATLNNIQLLHWPLRCGLYSDGALGEAAARQAPLRCTNCNSSTASVSITVLLVHCSAVLMCPLKG